MMKYKMKIFFAVTLFFSFDWACFAMPISPRSLRQLYGDAELIVVAVVEKTEKVASNEAWQNYAATLRVLSCIKGAEQETMVVHYDPHMVCPAPANYETGKTVLAFLKSAKNKDGYYTCSLSYGAKTLEDVEMKVYLSRMEELKSILAIKDEKLNIQKTTEWLVKCVAEKATRWEGILDLDGQNRWGMDRQKNNPEPEYWRYLTKEQENQFLAILESATPDKYGMPYEMSSIMSILSVRSGNKDLVSFVEKYRAIMWNDSEKEKKQKALLADFLTKYKDLSNKAIESDK